MINPKQILLLFISMLTAGCAGGIVGNGHVVSERRPVTSPIHNIVVTGATDTVIRQDAKESIEVHADSNLLPHILTTMQGTTLTVATKGSIRRGTLTVHITAKNLEQLNVQGASQTQLDYSSKAGMTISSSGASRIIGSAQIDNATLNLAGASHVDLQGSFNKITAHISGASKLDLQQSQITEMIVKSLSGASKLMLPTLQTLELKSVSGASKVIYRGTPQLTLGEITGASTVQRRD